MLKASNSKANTDEALALMKCGYELRISTNGDAELHSYPEYGDSAKPVKVYRSCAESLLKKISVQFYCNNGPSQKIYRFHEANQIEVATNLVEHYKTLCGKGSTVGDLLCDVMHYCQVNKIDFKEQMNYAERHFEAEKP